MKIDEYYSEDKEFLKKEKKESESEQDLEQEKTIEKIWNINPSYKDIKIDNNLTKIIFYLMSLLILVILTYLSTKSILMVLIAFGCGLVLLIIANVEDFFFLEHLTATHFKKISKLSFFKNIVFWSVLENPISLKQENHAIIYTNIKEQRHVGMKIFQLKIVSETIRPSLNQFIKSLYISQIPFTYQVIQTPILSSSKNNINPKPNALDAFEILIYFSVYYYVNGKISNQKIDVLLKKLDEYAEFMNIAISSNFHHFKKILLTKKSAIKSIKNGIISNVPSTQDIKEKTVKKKYSYSIINKLIVLLIFLIYALIIYNIALFTLKVPFAIVVLVNLLISIIFLSLNKRKLNSFTTLKKIKKNKNISIINDLRSINCFYLKKYSECLYFKEHEQLIGTKSFNLKTTIPPLFAFQGRFFRTLIERKIPFTYTIISAPVIDDIFTKNLDEKTIKRLNESKSPTYFSDWLEFRCGMWKSILLFSISSVTPSKSLKSGQFLDLENDLENKKTILLDSFNKHFRKFFLEQNIKSKLFSSLPLIALKNKHFRKSGTHLNYLVFQGKELSLLEMFVDEFKKGMKTRWESEFLSPLDLKNDIILGKTINTENYEAEIEFGLSNAQIKNLLITGGNYKTQELISYEIIINLIKTNKSVIFFDVSGNALKILNYFRDTIFEKDVLYFKLGTSISLKLFDSEISNDKNFDLYLDYIFDAWTIALKQGDREVQALKTALSKVPILEIQSLDTLMFNLQSQQEWEKDPIVESIVSMIKDLSQSYISFAQKEGDMVGIKELLEDNRSIIIDLSDLSTNSKQQVFTIFIFISKVIHYIKFSQKKCHKKILVVPGVDFFFDNAYLKKNANYGKIGKFIIPLRERRFGTIFLTNQIDELHNNLFSYFKNYIALRTINKPELAVIINLWNLKEFLGTGLYNQRRNDLKQIEFLKNLGPREAIVKRSDYEYPFPVIFPLKKIHETKKMSNTEVINHMKEQGFDLKTIENNIISSLRKTLFEKDLEKYSFLINEIKNFLEGIKMFDKIALNNEKKIKLELLKYIHPILHKKIKDKKKIIKTRNEIFELLLLHDYIVKTTEASADGSESVRTSYKIGEKYNKAVEDWFQSQKSAQPTIVDLDNNLAEKKIADNILSNFNAFNKNEKFRTELLDVTIRHLVYNLSKINDAVNKGKTQEAIELGSKIINNFILKLSNKYFERELTETKEEKNIEFLKDYLIKNQKLPFTKEELNLFQEKTMIENLSGPTLLEKAKEQYRIIWDFYTRIQNSINTLQE